MTSFGNSKRTVSVPQFAAVVAVFAAQCMGLVSSVTWPSNVALTVGSSTTLLFSPDVSYESSFDMVQWSFVVTGTSTAVVITSWDGTKCVPSPSYPQYQVNATNAAQGQCDLIIINVTTSQAGWYQCKATAGGYSFINNAQVTVFYSNPQCSQNVTENVAVNDVVSMTCSVSYSSEGVNATMTWSGCTYYTLSSDTSVFGDVTTTVSEIYIVAQQLPYLQTCDCDTTTGDPPTRPSSLPDGSVSTSTVRYESVWTSKVDVPVQSCPDNVTLSEPTNSYLPLNTTVTCRADGYPEPFDYELHVIIPYPSTVVNGSSVTLSTEGAYYVLCVVTNYITSGYQGNYTCTNRSPLYAYDVSASSVLHVSTTASTDSSTWTNGGINRSYDTTPTIVLGVFLAVSAVVNIIVLIKWATNYCRQRTGRKRGSTKNSTVITTLPSVHESNDSKAGPNIQTAQSNSSLYEHVHRRPTTQEPSPDYDVLDDYEQPQPASYNNV